MPHISAADYAKLKDVYSDLRDILDHLNDELVAEAQAVADNARNTVS